MAEIEGIPGDHLSNAAARAIKHAPCVLKFNDHRIPVEVGATVGDVEAAYTRACEEASKAYWTPDRLAKREREHKADREALAEHIHALDYIDLRDYDVAIKWLCGLEQLAMTHAPYDTIAVIRSFKLAGWLPGGLCSESGESSEEWAKRVGKDGQRRWLIGQALDGVLRVGAPHGVIHKFAAEMA